MKNLLYIQLLASILSLFLEIQGAELRWNWKAINPLQVSFPKNFLWGCSDSALQTEGVETVDGECIENSWTRYESTFDRPNFKVRVGKGCHRWTMYKTDIKLLNDIGMNAYRFSIEWSKIEPQKGVFNERAMEHYIDMVDEMLKYNIKPILTLFHHTYPIWFGQLGAFEKAENTAHFVRFARYVFSKLHHKVSMWIIFNEPVAYAIEGYYRGNYPPGKKSLSLAGQVASNMLNAHVAVAKVFRSIDRNAQIGIAHVIQPLDVYHKWNPLEHLAAKAFGHLVNDATLQFFKTGSFRWIDLRKCENSAAPQALDFIGINYYTHTVIKQTGIFTLKPTKRENERLLDKPCEGKIGKVLYPEGLYRAIKKASKLKKPIYITENGTSTDDIVLKDEYLKKHLFVLSESIKHYNVRGYFFWTLVDCFGWRTGYTTHHGIFRVDPVTQERIFNPACSYLVNVVKKFRNLT